MYPFALTPTSAGCKYLKIVNKLVINVCCPFFAAKASAVPKAKAVPAAKMAESSSEDSSDDSDSEEEKKPAKVGFSFQHL